MIHWSWVIFVIVVGGLSYKAYLSGSERSSGYLNIDLETPLYMLLIIVFILVWGGIFWW